MKIYHQDAWQYWYDRYMRCWYLALFDAEGNQIGDALDVYTKPEILKLMTPSMEALIRKKQPNGAN